MVLFNCLFILALLTSVRGSDDRKISVTTGSNLKITLLNTVRPYSGTKTPNVSFHFITRDKYNINLYDDSEDRQELESTSETMKRVVQTFLRGTNTTSSLKLLTCYYCGLSDDARACIDIKPGANSSSSTLTCAGPETICFATVLLEDNQPRCVLRGCQPQLHCHRTPLTVCCNTHLCNDQNLSNFEDIHKSLLQHWRRRPDDVLVYKVSYNEASDVPPTELFFITVLLILQTVVKVAIA